MEEMNMEGMNIVSMVLFTLAGLIPWVLHLLVLWWIFRSLEGIRKELQKNRVRETRVK